MFLCNLIIICLFSITSIDSGVLPDALPPEYRAKIGNFAKECLTSNPQARIDDLVDFVESKLPQGFNNWCYIACFSKKMNYILQNNTVNMKSLEERVSFIKTTDPELHKKQIELFTYCVETANKKTEPDECKLSESLYNCTSKKAKEFKIDRIM